jgi:2-(1,2-epoxy-1,2-dihydrophenyl)acetyl-CoA isomerase
MSELLVERSDGVLSITLNRAEFKNAINKAMMQKMAEIFRSLREDGGTRVVLILGKGADFSAGGDLKEIAPVLSEAGPRRAEMLRETVRETSHPLFLAMDDVPQPILLGVRGHIIGAAVQMAAVADLVIASETARFSIPQVKLAHTVDHGESHHLVRKIGLSRALQVCLLAERVDAVQAEKFGLVNWVVQDSELEERAYALAAAMASSPPVALRGMKSLLRSSSGNTREQQFAAEQNMIADCVATDDFLEAINSFTEKRLPVFKGS